MSSHCLVESHPLLPLLSVLIEISMSEKLEPILVKRLSYELIKMPPAKPVQDFFNGNEYAIDRAVKAITRQFLQILATILRNLMSSEETFKVLSAANEPFKKTRRRLPPSAEDELTEWLKKNSKHPYMNDDYLEDFCEKYEGIEGDQVRIFLTNARRKMSEGVRKRSKSQ